MKFLTYRRFCAIVFSYALSVLLYAGITWYDVQQPELNSNNMELVTKQETLLEK